MFIKATKKIIIIDDDPSILEMYSKKFSTQADWQILTAKNGKEGFELSKQHRPNLILVDIMMPKADGFDVLQKIKKDSALKDIPVIMLTNLVGEEDKTEAFKRGALDYLVKAEYTPSQVLEIIKHTLGI